MEPDEIGTCRHMWETALETAVEVEWAFFVLFVFALRAVMAVLAEALAAAAAAAASSVSRGPLPRQLRPIGRGSSDERVQCKGDDREGATRATVLVPVLSPRAAGKARVMSLEGDQT